MSGFYQNLRQFFLPTAGNDFYPISLRRQTLAFYVLFAVFLKLLSFAAVELVPSTGLFAEIVAKSIFAFTNEERQANGLPTLTESPLLNRVAYEKAMDMVTNGYFAHTAPDGKTPWYWFQKNGYNYKYAGENLAIDFFESNDVVRAWMASTGHRMNILNQHYSEIGMAVVKGNIEGRETTLVVQEFGEPKASGVLLKPVAFVSSTPRLTPPQRSPIAVSPVLSPALITASPSVSPHISNAPLGISSTNEESDGGNREFLAPVKFVEAAPQFADSLLGSLVNPRRLYGLLALYLTVAFSLGIFSRMRLVKHEAALGIVVVAAAIGLMLYLPDAITVFGMSSAKILQ